MKKISILLVLLFFFGCKPIDDGKINQCYLEKEKLIAYNGYMITKVFKFEYENHKYISFESWGEGFSVVHDPNCICFNKENY